MGNNLPDSCDVPWCSVQAYSHTWHEGVIDTWMGRDPNLPDVLRVLQLVAFARESLAGILPAQPQLALTITGPDLRRPDRVSVMLPDRKDWARVAQRISKRDL